jgi:AcrR family transcriptional regulator
MGKVVLVRGTRQAGGMTEASEPLRADARRNRDQILEAAAHAFVASGTDVPMEEIARAAGVGVGTLYRRFADREALVVAVVQHNVAALLARIRTAAAEEPLAWDALVRSMSYSRELKLLLPTPNLLPPNLTAALRDDATIRRLQQELRGLTNTLVEAAQREGTLRPDVGAGDVAQLFTLVYRATPAGSREVTDLAATRALAVILDGLRTGPRGPLPGRPLDTSDFERR